VSNSSTNSLKRKDICYATVISLMDSLTICSVCTEPGILIGCTSASVWKSTGAIRYKQITIVRN